MKTAINKTMKQPLPITLSNDVVTLIPMTQEYAHQFYEAGKDEATWRWTPPFQCETLETARQWITESLIQVKKGEQVMFGIIDNASGAFVGSTRYCSIDIANSALEIGFTFINPAFQRSHINSNCKLLLLTHAFEDLGAVRVQLRTHENNQKSRNAIARLGATFEGILRSQRLLSTGEYRNTALFSLLKNEWSQVKLTLQDKIAKHAQKAASQETETHAELDEQVTSIIKEFPLAQIMIASNDNLHDQIIYLPVRLEQNQEQKKNVLTGHLFINNKLVWLLENNAKVTVVFQGDDAYISPLMHDKIKVPTWNYRRVHITGHFRFLPPEQNKQQMTLQVDDLETGQWSLDAQPEQMINGMLANIRCFEISIERVDTIFKLDQQKPLSVKQAIAEQLIKQHKASLAKAHLPTD
ncbi:GNAT family N-acetyltransferase [Psychrosphaera sp. F3M07]|uniref:GNAT family N-acetyltransferase n=1 Tax=Psychrosphaera sp. F3M07 TaxID=2841560 RepID=UPI001C091A36|nr:GNAT family N-acetyltransferase [Psychrosphaera sp. F3M07]MBU2918493.1 GNAT family N-acetyltransferase [Psychrosphaera sp. F3M07]